MSYPGLRTYRVLPFSTFDQWSNYEGARGGRPPPERPGGPLETPGLRGYNGALASKRPPEITPQIQYMTATYLSF